MSWWTVLTGLVRPAKELVEVFKPNAEQTAQRGHAERMALTQQDLASLQQFASEFHARQNRTAWDSFIDGLNRLPRPLITLGIIAFFVIAPLDPTRFLQIATAYEMMPEGFWALLSIIIAFYFGGRLQIKNQDMAVKNGTLAAARQIAAARRELSALDQDDEPPLAGHRSQPGTAPNRVVQAWQRHANLDVGK